MKDIFKFSSHPKFESPSLIVGWQQDAGRLSPKVIECVNSNIKAQSFAELELVGFFSLGGVAIEDDIAQFPQCRFYSGQRDDLAVFSGSEPQYERHRFLEAVSDLAVHYCKAKDLYTVNGTISIIAHTSPRRILAVFNQQEFQKSLYGYGLDDMDWKGPPAISSYLLWIAKRRGIPGVSLWTEIPFYLSACEDFEAIRTTLGFLDKKFELGLDFGTLDQQVRKQNAMIAHLREQERRIDKWIETLEKGFPLSAEEQMELTRDVAEFLDSG